MTSCSVISSFFNRHIRRNLIVILLTVTINSAGSKRVRHSRQTDDLQPFFIRPHKNTAAMRGDLVSLLTEVQLRGSKGFSWKMANSSDDVPIWNSETPSEKPLEGAFEASVNWTATDSLTAELRFPSVEPRHAKFYTFNSNDFPVSAGAWLVVLGDLRCSKSDPSPVVKEGSYLQLECSIDYWGAIRPSLVWFDFLNRRIDNAVNVSSDSKTVTSTVTMRISDMPMTLLYTCNVVFDQPDTDLIKLHGASTMPATNAPALKNSERCMVAFAVDRRECSSKPCHNDAACTDDGLRGFSCVCPSGFTGNVCQTETDECLSTPCLNLASCQDGLNAYECVCSSGYTGSSCESNIDDCMTFPCPTNSVCVDLVNGYDCVCHPGNASPDCTAYTADCNSVRCHVQHTHECVNLVDGYACHCLEGYFGKNCETNINECASDPCRPGGSCFDQVNSFACNCLPSFSGILCETLDVCLSNPCHYTATCINSWDSFECICDKDFQGTLCDLPTRPCLSLPCSNDGQCIESSVGYTCSCRSAYSGTHCEFNIDECLSRPCVHASRCDDFLAAYRCVCQSGWTGSHCELELDECSSRPCYNNFTCQDLLNGYRCSCDAPFTGLRCGTLLPGTRARRPLNLRAEASDSTKNEELSTAYATVSLLIGTAVVICVAIGIVWKSYKKRYAGGVVGTSIKKQGARQHGETHV